MIGIIFATRLEADPFLESKLCHTEEPYSENNLTYLKLNGKDCVVCITGMGPKLAQEGIRSLLDTNKLDFVINAGAVGALTDKLAIGTMCIVRKALIWPDTDSSFTLLSSLGSNSSSLTNVNLVTVNEPVFDDTRRRELAEYADVVDMEGAVIANECHKKEIPCCEIKGVSDSAMHGHKEMLKKNIQSVAESFVPFLADIIGWKS